MLWFADSIKIFNNKMKKKKNVSKNHSYTPQIYYTVNYALNLPIMKSDLDASHRTVECNPAIIDFKSCDKIFIVIRFFVCARFLILRTRLNWEIKLINCCMKNCIDFFGLIMSFGLFCSVTKYFLFLRTFVYILRQDIASRFWMRNFYWI